MQQVMPCKVASNFPIANTNAVVTLAAPADANARHAIAWVSVSYSAAPTGGRITITDGGVTVFDLDITAAGEHLLDIPVPMEFGLGNAVVLTLAAAGAAVTGKLNVGVYAPRRG